MPAVFKGWWYDGKWNNYPSPEWETKFDNYLLPLGAKKIRKIDPNVNYVELINKRNSAG